MAGSTYIDLLEDLRHNDRKSFRNVLEKEGLPQDDHWFDYDLLVKAIRKNRKLFVGYLLNKRCRVNKPRTIGHTTPLHMVAKKLGWSDVIDKMLQLGARMTDVDTDGNTPLHVAFLHGLSDLVVNKLLQHYKRQSCADIRNKDGLGFMHIACTRSDRDSLKEFFDVGLSDIYSQVSMLCDSIYAGYSPLHFAVAVGKPDIVRFLCEYNADVYAQDRNGSTPLHLALEKRNTVAIDILCSHDSKNENYVNAFGVSHFMAACAGSDVAVVEEFLQVAMLNRSSYHVLLNGRVQQAPHQSKIAGYTPIHFACEFGRAETVCKLLCIGAWDQCAIMTTELNLTPYELAAKQQHEQICYIIEQYYNFVQQANQQQHIDVGQDLQV